MPKKVSRPKKAVAKKSSPKKAAKKSSPRKWSKKVNETSDALDLDSKIFKSKDPHKIALSLKRSAEKSNRKKTTPFQSAMSMLNFYINRGGKNLSADDKKVLEKSKEELRVVFNREKEK